jgi:cell division protein FtsI (penicillin-binding protein 3)
MAQVSNKEEIKSRARTVVFIFGVLFIVIVARIIYLQNVVNKQLLKDAASNQQKKRTIYATRGNIYASDGLSLLATSVPKYTSIIDPVQAKPELFEKSIDSLASLLANFYQDKTVEEYKERIVNARKAKNRYLSLGNRKIDHTEKLLVSRFPLFREKPYKGGGRFDKEEQRFLPLQNLAMRTIGKMKRDDPKKGDFGIEASFENYLKGKDGQGYYERLAGGYLKPVDLESDINSEQGLDVVTTLDINFQDIAESALKNQVVQTNARYGAAVIMEIATGHVKAITNLTRYTNGEGILEYREDQNYAVKEGSDPGSTFKLASMAAILEHSTLKLSDYAVNCTGEIKHADRSFTCSHGHGELTVQQVFEKSCNIGVYALMKKVFGFNNPDDYYAYLEKFRLTQPTGFQLKGEPMPYLKTAKSKTFSRTTMPWMSIGYESRMTPLQMLTFYNAVANDGRWVQPIIVKQIRKGAKIESKIEANIIDQAFMSAGTIAKLKTMMEGVVLNGTAKNVNNGNCQIAGKTGTAQKRIASNYTQGRYYTSFIGYFPANKPRYSCMVVIDEPQGANQYGADVSAPVFKTIAEKIFSYDISLHPRFIVKANTEKLARIQNAGNVNDHKLIAKKLGVSLVPEGTGYASASVGEDKVVTWKSKNPDKNLDAIVGLSLKDVLPILENKGYKVAYHGLGKVKSYTVMNARNVSLILN